MNFTRPSVSRYYRYFIKLPNPKLTNKILWRKKTPFDLQKNIEHQVPSYKEMVSMNLPPLQTCGENLVNCEQVFFHQVPGAHNFPKQIDSEWNFPENSWLEDNFISFWGFGFLAGAIVCWFLGVLGMKKQSSYMGRLEDTLPNSESTWKVMVGMRSCPFGPGLFLGAFGVSFREGNSFPLQ